MSAFLRRSAVAVLIPLAGLGLASEAGAQERPYTNGSVWDVTYVKTTPGHFDDYLEDLAQGWKKVNDAAMEKGLIKSYKIISAPAANGEDWDLILLTEYPNWAVFDGADEKFDPIVEEVLGNLGRQSQATIDRSKLRVILGSKMGQELVLK